MSRSKRLKRLPVLIGTFALAGLVVAALAIADVITGDANSVTTNIDSTRTVAPGASGSGLFGLTDPNSPSGDASGCNAGTGGSKPPVVLGVSSSKSWLTVTQSTITLTDCDRGDPGLQNAQTVNYSVASNAPAGETATVTAVYQSGGVSGGRYTSGSFQIQTPAVVAPANQAPSAPGAPALASGSSTPNQGVFGLIWTASTDDGLPAGSSISYRLQHKDADDGSYSDVNGATALTTNSFSFTSGSPEAEGTWTYQVRASDGSLTSAYSGPSSAVKVDKSGPSAPTAALDRTAEYNDGTDDWFKDTVTVSYSGSTDPNLADGSSGSGVSAYTPDETFSTSGTHNYSGKATDNVGNESSAASGSVKVDATNPTVDITGCPAASVKLGSSQTVDVAASDGQGSGIDPNNDPTATGVALPTNQIGQQTATFTAKDNVGHEKSESCQYRVIYDWSGFFQPVDNNGVFNKVKAGSSIPAKFSLAGNQGLSILALQSPVSARVINCSTAAGVDNIESTSTAGNSSLSYDALADQYNYVWKTDKSWAGQCRQLNVTLVDGTSHTANFQFTK